MTSGAKYRRTYGMKQAEIEPGRSVPNIWDKHLIERWADRKKRRAAEREARAQAEAAHG